MGKKIDHEYTPEIVCPYCGCEFTDSFEIGIGEEDLGLIECDECGKEFYGTRDISISYVTQKATYGTCKHCNTDNVIIEDYHSSMGKYSGLCVKCGALEKKRLQEEYIKFIEERARK